MDSNQCSVRSIVAAHPWSGLAARFALTNSGRLPAADSPLWGTIRVVTQWVIRHRRKQGGVLTRAVRGTGIPSAVRVRFLIEANSGLQQKQYPLCRPRLRKTLPSRNLNHHIARLERFALLVSVDSFGSLLPYSKCPTGAPLPSLPPSM